MYKKTLFGLSITACLFLAMPTWAMQVFPARQTAVVDPGARHKFVVTVTNDSTGAKSFQGEVSSFTLDPVTNAIQFHKNDPFLNFFSLSKRAVTLSPGESGEIEFVLSVPKDTTPGARYIVLFATEVGQESGADIVVGSRVGSLLFLHVGGDIREDLQVKDFSTDRDWYFAGTPIVRLTLVNQGSIHVVPAGEVVISNFLGDTVAKSAFNPSGQKILSLGEWYTEAPLHLDWKDAGKMRVQLSAVYGIENQAVSTSFTFWFLPWPVLVGAGISVVLIGVCVFFFFRKK